MAKIDFYLENKSRMLLSSVATIGSYSENKLLMLLSLICRNYPKIIINSDSGRATVADAVFSFDKASNTLVKCCSVRMSKYSATT